MGAYAADDCRGIYASDGYPAFALDQCVGYDGLMSQYVCDSDVGYYEVYSGSDCSGNYLTRTEVTTGMYAVCDSSLDDCEAITLTGYIDSATFASCDASGTEYTMSYASECGTYTSGSATWSHQYVCESGCMVSKTWSNSDCSGSCQTATKVADSGILSCLSCDNSEDTCDDYTLDTCDGAAQWMTTAVLALAVALWTAM